MPTSQQNIPDSDALSRAPWWGMAAAFAAALGAGLCCAGPLIYLVFGISAAGFARLPWLESLQGPLAVFSVLCLFIVFFRLYMVKRPHCVTGSNRYLRSAFWVTTFLSAVLLTYPYALGWWLA